MGNADSTYEITRLVGTSAVQCRRSVQPDGLPGHRGLSRQTRRAWTSGLIQSTLNGVTGEENENMSGSQEIPPPYEHPATPVDLIDVEIAYAANVAGGLHWCYCMFLGVFCGKCETHCSVE